MPFSLQYKDSEEVLNGVIESHQLAEGDTPMLLSLHAQAALGISKNMRTCEITIDGKPLEWFRCSRTGLLMLNLTQGLRDANQESQCHLVPKCHRPYRSHTCFMTAARDGRRSTVQFGTSYTDHLSAEEHFCEVLESSVQVILVTTAERFERFDFDHSYNPSIAVYHPFNCKSLYNPEHNPSDRSHLGYNPKLLKGIIESEGFERLKNQVLRTVTSANGGRVLINLSCTSNRHRSVGFGFTMYHILKTQGYSIELLHWNSSHWDEMACGGRYACCQNSMASLRVIRHLLTIPAASSRPAVPAPAEAPPARSTSSRRTIAVPAIPKSATAAPSRRTSTPITVDDDPVRTSHGHGDSVGAPHGSHGDRGRADVRTAKQEWSGS